MGSLYLISSPQGSGIIVEERSERLSEPEAVDEYKERVVLRHDRETVYMNSACNTLSKLKPDPISSWRREADIKSYLSPRYYW